MPSKRTEGCLHITCLETLISFQLTCTKTCRFQVFTLSTRRNTHQSNSLFTGKKEDTRKQRPQKKQIKQTQNKFFFQWLSRRFFMGERQGERPPKIADIQTPDNIATQFSFNTYFKCLNKICSRSNHLEKEWTNCFYFRFL